MDNVKTERKSDSEPNKGWSTENMNVCRKEIYGEAKKINRVFGGVMAKGRPEEKIIMERDPEIVVLSNKNETKTQGNGS